ncbi:MAG: Uma2 family endonuclease [Janthinobacterium lividum]
MASSAAVPLPRIPVSAYMESVFRPDVDYVDGELEERNVGEVDHATLQKMILLALTALEEEGGFYSLQETRVQTSATRFRIPDVCVIPADRIPDRIIQEPPMLCVEVLSPRDDVMRMQQRCMDYIRMGVPEVWIFDPGTETAYVMRGDSMVERKAGILTVPGKDLQLTIEDLFEAARKRKPRP